MKIEIDLNNILADEYGPAESLAQSIHRQVVESVKSEIDKGIKKQIDEELSKYIGTTIKTEVDKLMPGFVAQLMDTEYMKVGRYGDRDTKTTFRNEMLKTIVENMEYKPEKDPYYSNRENAFTKAVKSIITVETEKFQKEFNSIVTKEFTASTVKMVTEELRKKFAIVS